MAQRFDRQIATALRLIKKNGQLVKWRQKNRVIDEDFKEKDVIVERDVWVCFLPVDKEMREFFHYLRGSNTVKGGSVVGLMGNVPFEPNPADFVVRGSETLEISSVDLLSPNGQKILYTIEFKS